jgi:sugar phosphate isomerase/epimerase
MKCKDLLGFTVWLAIAAVYSPWPATAQETPSPAIHVAHAGLQKLKWQLACRGSTFHGLSTFEMIDLLHSMNFHHIEISPGQVLSTDHSDVKIGDEMTADQTTILSAKLKTVGMDIVSYGVSAVPSNQADTQKLFEFGKRLKVKNIVMGDPSADSLPMLDALAGQFGINVAIVTMSTPDAIANKLQGRSARLGICAEPAEWRHAGIDPVAALQSLRGRVIEIHLQDFNAQAKETPLGGGTANLAPFLEQCKSENFRGICCISYESGSGPELQANFVKSVNWLSDRVNELADIH